MGALTSKTYTYKSRPWELRSKDTISLKDPFLPLIRAYVGQKQILRILPVVGEEEWLSDNSRFFESQRFTTSCVIKLVILSEYNINRVFLSEIETFQRKLSLKETLISMALDIENKKELSIIVGAETDITVLSAIRKFDNLKEILKINVFNPTAQQEISNTIITEEDLKNHTIILMTPTKEISPLFDVKLQDFIDEGGELISFHIPESADDVLSHLGASKNTLHKILSGRVLTKLPPLFIIPDYLKSIIPTTFKTFILGKPVDNCFFGNYEKSNFKSSSNILNLDADLHMIEDSMKNTYLISPSYLKLKTNQIYIPALSFWNENRLYKTMFNEIHRSYAVLLFKNSANAMVDFLTLFHVFLQKRLQK